MDETYGTYGDDECFDIRDYDDDTDDDYNDDTDDGGRGNLYTINVPVCTKNRLQVLMSGQNKKSRHSIKKIFFAVQNSLWGIKKTNNICPFSGGGVLKSQIQPEWSTHSPTEVKETLN